MGHSWPGNVRELQNLIERAVILSSGKRIQVPPSELKRADACRDLAGQSAAAGVVTLREVEREHILRALAQTNWIIGGKQGAAARLGLKRTTLCSKMERMGISRAMT